MATEFNSVYVDNTLGVGVGLGQGWPDRPGPVPFAGGGYHSIFMVENTNRNCQIVAQFWSNDHTDDGAETYVVFVTTADSTRPHSRNVGIRVDAVNFAPPKDGPSTGLLVNVHGVNGNKNRGVHVAVDASSDAYAFVVTNAAFGGDAEPCWSVDRRGTIRSAQLTEIEQRIGALERLAGLPSSTKSWWQFWR